MEPAAGMLDYWVWADKRPPLAELSGMVRIWVQLCDDWYKNWACFRNRPFRITRVRCLELRFTSILRNSFTLDLWI